MEHRSPEHNPGISETPPAEQLSFFPEDKELVEEMQRIREEQAAFGRKFPLNDEYLKGLAQSRLAHRKSGKSSVRYHGDSSA